METFKIVAKKHQKLVIRRTVTIASLVAMAAVIVGFLIHLLLIQLVTGQYNDIRQYYHERSIVAFPNLHLLYHETTPMTDFGGEFTARFTKDLAGIPVRYEEVEVDYGVMGGQLDWHFEQPMPVNNRQDSTAMSYSQKRQLKTPLFFNPHANYGPEDVIRQPAEELLYVPEMKGQLVEVALSFDKRYTYQEIQERLPKNLKLNWLWIGTETDLATNKLSLGETLGWEPSPEFTEERYIEFTDMLQAIYEDDQFMGKMKEDVTTYLQEAETGFETTRYGGVIITGRAEDFTELQEVEWIFASSIGLSVPNQPYHTLDVE